MDRRDLEELVYSSCLALDEEDFNTFLKCYAEDMRYCVSTYSPELRKEMIWLDHNRQEMKDLFKMLPQHVRMLGKFSRHATVARIVQSEKNWSVTSRLILHYTDPDGTTTLMAVGRYEDTMVEREGLPIIVSRHVALDTRDLGPGIHVPI